MFRKIVLLISILALLSMAVAVSASDPLAAGCYVDTGVNAVNEGGTFTATVKCNTFASVYGVELGTTLSGDATTAATSYTIGTFQSAATSPLVGLNTLALYGVSRSGADAATGDFTIGSFLVTANKGLTADGSTTIDIPSLGFKISDSSGAPITGLLQSGPEAIVTVTDISLAQLSGTIRVKSDGAVGSLAGIDFNLGDGVNNFTAGTAAAAFKDYPISNLEYTAATDGALKATMTLDMTSHLACSSDYTLIDGVNAATTQIGVGGTITLKAGDVVTVADAAINIQDSTAVGAAFGTSSTAPVDVNRDGKVDIFDLVHIGRNYNATQGTCS